MSSAVSCCSYIAQTIVFDVHREQKAHVRRQALRHRQRKPFQAPVPRVKYTSM